MQEHRLKKVLQKTLQLQPGTKDFHKIETSNDDFLAETVYEVINSRSGSKEGSLSISEVDNSLNLISGDQLKQLTILSQKSSAVDMKWLVKILLKRMNLMVSDKKILDNYHSLANGLFERYNHLSKVCEFVEAGNAEQALNEIKPFLPIRAMLSQKVTSDSNKNFLEKEDFYAETKMDGERFQIHMKDNEYKFYSRNAHDYSDGFKTFFTPHLKFNSIVHSIILDGEMLVWSKLDNRLMTKGESNVDVKRIPYESKLYQPYYFAFDVLYLNGISYINRPYSDRSKILQSLIIDLDGIIKRVENEKIRDNEHFASILNIAMNNNEEGIILKSESSSYKPGERNGGWYKVKPDYFDGNVVKEFDVVIIGGFFQNEHTEDFLQKYIVGAIENKSDETFNVYAIGEAMHGLTEQKRLELSKTLIDNRVKYSGEEKVCYEKGMVFFGKSRPNIFIPPHKSRILQIRASELAVSSDYYTPYTFRFPRIQHIRTDKIWNEIELLQEFQALFNNSEGNVVKINQRKVYKEDVTTPPKSKKSRNTLNEAIYKFCQDPQVEISPIDTSLAGLEFCVLSTRIDLPSEHDLKILLRLHGASLTSFPRKNKTFAIIAGDLSNRTVRNYTIKPNADDNHNVLKSEWVEKFLDANKALKTQPKIVPCDFLFMTEKLKKRFKKKFDKYGDSYRDQIKDVNELKEILDNMKFELSDTSLKSFDIELFDEILPNPNFFRGLEGAFIKSSNDMDIQISIAESIFKFRAGKVVEEKDASIIFVEKLQFKKYELRADLKNREIINCQWIFDSNEAGKMLNMSSFKM